MEIGTDRNEEEREKKEEKGDKPDCRRSTESVKVGSYVYLARLRKVSASLLECSHVFLFRCSKKNKTKRFSAASTRVHETTYQRVIEKRKKR